MSNPFPIHHPIPVNNNIVENQNYNNIMNEPIVPVPHYRTYVSPDDVLIGTGAQFMYNEGNKRFRQVVLERKDEYQSSKRRDIKNAIVIQIVNEIIHNRRGLFLRQVIDLDDAKNKGYIPHESKVAYVIAEDAAIYRKVTTALREPPPSLLQPKRKWISKHPLPAKIMKVEPNDVLLGRGTAIFYNEGNLRFRKLVAKRKLDYKNAKRSGIKTRIAQEVIYETIHLRKGRFLRLVKNDNANQNVLLFQEELKDKMHVPIDDKSAWVVADDDAVMKKVKQSLREPDDDTAILQKVKQAIRDVENQPLPSSVQNANNGNGTTTTIGPNGIPIIMNNKPKSSWIAKYPLPPKIQKVLPNDILIGRGAAIFHNEGNVRFRKIIAERKVEYILSRRSELKDIIAKEIVTEILMNRNGRFLRLVEGGNLDDEIKNSREHVLIDHKSAWVLADDAVIIEKVKQALRQLDSTPVAIAKRKKAAAANASLPPTTNNGIPGMPGVTPIPAPKPKRKSNTPMAVARKRRLNCKLNLAVAAVRKEKLSREQINNHNNMNNHMQHQQQQQDMQQMQIPAFL